MRRPPTRIQARSPRPRRSARPQPSGSGAVWIWLSLTTLITVLVIYGWMPSRARQAQQALTETVTPSPVLSTEIADRTAPPGTAPQQATPPALTPRTAAPGSATQRPTSAPPDKTPAVVPATPSTADERLHSSVGKPASIQEGFFEIPSRIPSLPLLRCDYRIPLGSNGRPLATAADIALLFPFPTEKAAIKGLGSALTNRYGFTTLSLQFPGMAPKDGVDATDPGAWYYYPESGAGPAWLAAIDHLRELAGLPSRTVFVTGRSGGGSAAALFADAYPDRVAAVVNEAGRVYAQAPRFRGPVLIVHGAHDYVVPAITDHIRTCEALGLSVCRFTFPPNWGGRGSNPIWQHSIHGPMEKAQWRWMADVADTRQADGTIPPPSSWQVQRRGQPCPSQAFADLIDQVPESAVVHYIEGTSILVARPLKPARGLILTVSCDFTPDTEDLLLDGEYLAEKGWLSISACGESTAKVGQALLAWLATQEADLLAGRPAALIVDQVDGVEELLALRRGPWLGVISYRSSASVLEHMTRTCAAAKTPLLYVEAPEILSARRAVLGDRDGLSWAAADAKNLGMWHRKRCEAVEDTLARWTARDR